MTDAAKPATRMSEEEWNRIVRYDAPPQDVFRVVAEARRAREAEKWLVFGKAEAEARATRAEEALRDLVESEESIDRWNHTENTSVVKAGRAVLKALAADEKGKETDSTTHGHAAKHEGVEP